MLKKSLLMIMVLVLMVSITGCFSKTESVEERTATYELDTLPDLVVDGKLIQEPKQVRANKNKNSYTFSLRSNINNVVESERFAEKMVSITYIENKEDSRLEIVYKKNKIKEETLKTRDLFCHDRTFIPEIYIEEMNIYVPKNMLLTILED